MPCIDLIAPLHTKGTATTVAIPFFEAVVLDYLNEIPDYLIGFSNIIFL